VSVRHVKAPMKKKRQHHVWQHYLKSWTVDGNLYCLRDGNILRAGTLNVAVERDFYKLHKVTPADLKLIHFLASDIAHPTLQKLHHQFLTGMAAPIIRFGELAKKDKLVSDALDLFMTNALEDVYAGIETKFIPLLARIKAGDTSFYFDSEKSVDFLYFVCTQYMRTKAIRVRTIERLNQNGLMDLTRVWNLMSYLYALNIGFSLYIERRRRKLVLIENRTDVPFITGDQPVTNLLGNGMTSPEWLVLYYPISPTIALVLSEADKEPPFTNDDLTPEKVAELNERIFNVSDSQLFASSTEPLLPLRDRA
jgi:Protein of unknown function (DUF4238)